MLELASRGRPVIDQWETERNIGGLYLQAKQQARIAPFGGPAPNHRRVIEQAAAKAEVSQKARAFGDRVRALLAEPLPEPAARPGGRKPLFIRRLELAEKLEATGRGAEANKEFSRAMTEAQNAYFGVLTQQIMRRLRDPRKRFT